uniref:Sperm-tail PG-rich repeat containing 4 n=1 Tax=Chelydra serpentina TaxID=8475 RepID=A0A8C3SXB5_CHESE
MTLLFKGPIHTTKTTDFGAASWEEAFINTTPIKCLSWLTPGKEQSSFPCTYIVRDFIEEAQLNPVKTTYNFKGEGRKRRSIFQPTADLTLPDVYTYIPPSFVDLAGKKPATYSFKSTPRKSPSTLCFKDKSVSQMTLIASFSKFRQFMFRSAVQRFPTTYFTPKEGPGPGEYEMKGKPPHPVSSCFQSKVPRLQPVRSKIPGPGAYEPTRQFPKQPRTIASLGHEHSIFFSNTFGF